ncbi:ATP-binding protein [Sunxiuqinia elliptica]
MVADNAHKNAVSMEQELNWFSKVLDTRLKLHMGQECSYQSIEEVEAPKHQEKDSIYAAFINYYQLDFAERLLLMLAFIPHIRPQLLDPLMIENKMTNRGWTELGGILGKNHSGVLPTGETFLFLMAGNHLEQRFLLTRLFQGEHIFARHHILKLDPAPDGEPFLSGVIQLSRDMLDYLTMGEYHQPVMSSRFPAKRITTERDWSDLVVDDKTRIQIDEIKTWLEYGNALLYDWGMSKKLRKGYRCLFYGSSGTGKTMTACLLGKDTNRDVYRVDLSLVVSKYIGETEKNLSAVFDQAEHKNWILFFDEADALFGKRTNVSDAHDRFANQEVSYLLQRIEDYNGLVVLASNQKDNMDDAFTRRFDNMINFALPKPGQRLKIWEQAFAEKSSLAPDVSLNELAKNYELSGGAIMNAVGYASLMTLKKNSKEIAKNDLLAGVHKEFQKEGRTV